MNEILEKKDLNNDKKENLNEILKEKFIEWSTSSTSHGYPNIFKTKRISLKIMWTVFFLAATGFCLYLVYESVSNYFQYDVVTKIQFFKESSVNFPAVAFCNKIFFSKNFSYGIINNVIQLNKNQSFNEYHESAKNHDFFNNDMKNTYTLTNSLFAMFSPEFTNDDKKAISYSIDEILIGCSFNLQSCSSKDFIWYFDIEGGNCFKFNSGYDSNGKKVEIKESKLAGSYNGLTLQLYVGQSNNINQLSKSRGIRLMINNQTIRNRYSEGVDIPTGFSTNVKLKRTFYEKLPIPYSDCQDLTNYDSVLYKAILNLNLTYRQEDCFDLCLQKKNIENCGCCNLYHPCLFDKEFCLNTTQVNCVYKTYLNFIDSNVNDICSSLCPIECESMEIGISTSSSKFPTRSFYEFYKDNAYFKKTFQTENISYEMLSENILELNIYYETFKYTKTEESQVSTVIDLISNVGGTLGLLIGISMLSLIEILEIIIEIILTAFESFKPNKINT